MHPTDQIREEIEKHVAAQNVEAAKRCALILQCHLADFTARHIGKVEMQQIRWEYAA